MIKDQWQEIYGISTIAWKTILWVRSFLLNDRAVELSTAKVSFSLIRWFVSEAELRSTLDLWRLGKAKLSGSRGSRMSWVRRCWRTSRVRVENIPWTHDTAVTSGSPKNDGGTKYSAWKVQRSNHLHVDVQRHWLGTKRKQKTCTVHSWDFATYAAKFPKGHWSFSGSGFEEKWYGTHIRKSNGSRNRVADLMMIHLRKSGHPPFRWTSALSRGSLKSKGGGRSSTRNNADLATAVVLFRIIISVNQLSVNGAVADWREELAQQISVQSSTGTRNPVAKVNDESESKVSPTDVPILTQLLLINVPAQGTGSCRENTSPRDDKGSTPKLEIKVSNYMERYEIEIKVDSMQNDGSQSWIVTSRGIGKYVNELPEDNKKSIHYEDVASSAGKLVAIKQQEQFIPYSSSSSSSSTVMPINQRKWNDISAATWWHVLQNLETNDPTSTTSRLSPRRWWSNWTERVVS